MSETDLQKNDGTYTALASTITTAVDVKNLAMLPTAEIEGVLHLALEDAFKLTQTDPLAGLHALVQIMMAGDLEALRNYMPSVISSSQATSRDVAATGRKVDLSQSELRGLSAVRKVQDSLIKNGLANVKITDELARRERARQQAEEV